MKRPLKNYFIWRRGIIYAYSCLDFYSKDFPNVFDYWAYIGQTRQNPQNRHAQHMEEQPWSDLEPQMRILVEFSHCPNWWLNMVEKILIKFKKPTYNYIHNLQNPMRIPKPQAKHDRKLRNRKRRIRLL